MPLELKLKILALVGRDARIAYKIPPGRIDTSKFDSFVLARPYSGSYLQGWGELEIFDRDGQCRFVHSYSNRVTEFYVCGPAQANKFHPVRELHRLVCGTWEKTAHNHLMYLVSDCVC